MNIPAAWHLISLVLVALFDFIYSIGGESP
jgi:hypothetical protein